MDFGKEDTGVQEVKSRPESLPTSFDSEDGVLDPLGPPLDATLKVVEEEYPASKKYTFIVRIIFGLLGLISTAVEIIYRKCRPRCWNSELQKSPGSSSEDALESASENAVIVVEETKQDRGTQTPL